MSIKKHELFKKISDAVVEMDEDTVILLSNQVIEEKLDAYEAITEGLSQGMERAGVLFEEEEYFVTELLMCSDAMYAGIDVLEPYLNKSNKSSKYKIVIGVVEGDTHDIGKTLVKLMLDAAGFEVLDIGRDVPPIKFYEEAKRINADIIAVSNLMTTTMKRMEEVIGILEEQNDRGNFKVMVGGGCISQDFADKIKADGYSANAVEAVRLAKSLVGYED
ncbi:corrinoid protein [Clostridium sp. WILCCON 0269]|uniref:Corrinoid protein n=1 Tax=Candidatus Clostridium eludens TaxID=3381663 RepID=A0ABW8SF82_9CLOT